MYMGKFRYVRFGNGVPKEIEKEYNKMLRQEQYQEENDYLHGLVKVDYYALLQVVADHKSLPGYEEELKEQRRRMLRLDLLAEALEVLRAEAPDDYYIISEYYYSEEKIRLRDLAAVYSVTPQAICKRMKKVRNKLKDYIILHEKER